VANLYESKLAEWGLSRKQVERRGWKLISTEQACTLLGYPVEATECIYIPYLGFDAKPIKYGSNKPFFQVRLLGGSSKLRYRQPRDSGIHLYLPSAKLDDGKSDLFITEGAAKAEAGAANSYNVVGVLSSTCWRVKELEKIELKDRRVYIVFDSDAVSNPDVCKQENALARWLTERGALVFIVRLPSNPELKKVGMDDFLRLEGKEAFAKLLDEDTEPFEGCEQLHQLNEEVRYIRSPSSIVKIANGQVMSCATFTNEAFRNRKYNERQLMPKGGEKLLKKYAAREWLEWDHRAEVERMTYAPGESRITEAGELNRWTGWGVEPKKGDVKPFLRLVDFLCAAITPEQKEWFIQWLAYPLQHPGTKLFSAVVVWGREQGTGKSRIGHTMYKIYGSNCTEITNEHLTSAFNASWAEMKQFVMGEEIVCGEDNNRTIYNRLKSWVTQPILKINQKYIPTYEVPDRINYYFTSNSPDAFYLADEDRRFFVVEVKDRPLSKEFYDGYTSWLESGGASALFDYLLSLDLTGFDPTGRPPETSAKRELIDGGRTSAELWASALKTAPDEMTTSQGIGTSYSLYTIKKLTEYALFHTPHEERQYITEKSVGKALAKAKFHKVQCGDDGRIKIPGEGFPRLWIVRNSDKLTKIANPDKIREIYLKERK
jgi:hypothetical protein